MSLESIHLKDKNNVRAILDQATNKFGDSDKIFDEINQDVELGDDKINIKPFHSIDRQDPKELLNWCVKVVSCT